MGWAGVGGYLPQLQTDPYAEFYVAYKALTTGLSSIHDDTNKYIFKA